MEWKKELSPQGHVEAFKLFKTEGEDWTAPDQIWQQYFDPVLVKIELFFFFFES